MSFYSMSTRIACALISHPDAYRSGDKWVCPGCGAEWRA